MGGLGNQLFQYAAGRRLAIEHGTDLVLDLGWIRYEAHMAATPRQFELWQFDVSADRVEFDPLAVARWERRQRRFRRPAGLTVVRQAEGDMSVDPRVLDAPDNVLLIGYWQSEQYFFDVRDDILKELGFANQTDGRLAAVHVRRGDYVTHERTKAFHGVLPELYYREALRFVAERSEASHFYAFSDDPNWVEQKLASSVSFELVRGGTPHDDLRRMAGCRHHVIANSSFSWWGAWLGEGEGSVVVAPMRWFADATVDASSIVPERWVRL
jgi:hypothetical protein